MQFRKGRANRNQVGDISPISELGERLTNLFVPECKHYRDLQMIGLYLGLKSGVNVHWAETCENALRHKKWPLLIAKQNRLDPFVMLSHPGLQYLDLKKHVLAHFPALGVYVLWYASFLKFAKRPE